MALKTNKALNVAFQMDPFERLHLEGDSTFALMLEADARGHDLFFYTPDKLSLIDGKAIATGHPVKVKDDGKNYVSFGKRQRVELSSFDVVQLRQDPPFDMNYISTTHILETIHPKTLVVNDPAEVRNAPEKIFVMNFPEFMPPTLITRDQEEVIAFRDQYKEIILKPLYGNGGAGVLHLRDGDTNLVSLVELFLTMSPEPFIVQQYLPDVRAGDKRIILVDGTPAGAINRVPAAHETRSNMHIGGRPEAIEITPRERDICEAIGPELKKRGLIFVGIDVIGGLLTEINVTSPTGLREIKRLGKIDIAPIIWQAIEDRL